MVKLLKASNNKMLLVGHVVTPASDSNDSEVTLYTTDRSQVRLASRYRSLLMYARRPRSASELTAWMNAKKVNEEVLANLLEYGHLRVFSFNSLESFKNIKVIPTCTIKKARKREGDKTHLAFNTSLRTASRRISELTASVLTEMYYDEDLISTVERLAHELDLVPEEIAEVVLPDIESLLKFDMAELHRDASHGQWAQELVRDAKPKKAKDPDVITDDHGLVGVLFELLIRGVFSLFD